MRMASDLFGLVYMFFKQLSKNV